MSPVRWLPSFASAGGAVRRLVARKLGACPLCIRTSALLAAGSWVAFLSFSALFPDGPARALALALALLTTVLFAAHVVAFTVRAARALRCSRASLAPAAGPGGEVLPRSEFLLLLGRSLAGLFAFVAFGGLVAFRRQGECEGRHDEDGTEEGGGATEREAKEDTFDKARARCDAVCARKGPCSGACVRTAEPITGWMECERPHQIWFCTVFIKQCICGCKQCRGKHRPPSSGSGWPDDTDIAHGIGANQGEARAKMTEDGRGKCRRSCRRFRDCEDLERCTFTPGGDPKLGKIKVWNTREDNSGSWHASAKIEECECACR